MGEIKLKNLLCFSLIIMVIGYSQPPGGGFGDQKKARMIKKWKLIEYLDLSEEQSEKFFVRVNAFQKEMKGIHKKGKNLREEIRDLLEEDKLKDNKVDKLIDEYFDIQSEILNLRRSHHEGIADVLTAEQTVKYLVFDHKFKKSMQDQFLDQKGRHGKGPRR